VWFYRNAHFGTLLSAQVTLECFFFATLLFCNLFLSIDLVLTVRNPFYPKEWRTSRMYLPITLLLSFLIAIMTMLTTGLSDTDTDLRYNIELALFIGYIVVTLACNLLGFVRLRRPGISKKMRMSFLKYQILYASIGFVINVLFFGRDIFYRWKYGYSPENNIVIEGRNYIIGNFVKFSTTS